MVANTMAAKGCAPERYRFGKFVLEPGRRTLTAGGTPVTLSARAFDLLRILVERRDRIVTKDALRAEVWRGLAVDDNNLAVQISVLRRALGEKPGDAPFILTVPGQGYQFVAAVDGAGAPPPPAAPERAHGAAAPAREAAGVAAPARPLPWRPIAMGVCALMAMAAAGGFAVKRFRAQDAPRLSIAVLPFRNLSGQAGQDYLADAISDDLTTDLSHIPGSMVTARASADTFRGRTVTADGIGRALNVRYLLEGSLLPEGSSLHINAQLIDAPSGGHLWARAFDVPKDRLGTARTEIVRSIASALDITLLDIESARSLQDRPGNADAVDFYLRARSVISRGTTLADLGRAQDLLEKSVAQSPDFADALAALGTVLARKVAEFDDPDDDRDFARAQVVVARAVTLAPQNPATITAKGNLAWAAGSYSQAMLSFQLVLSMDPDDLTARNGMALCARQLGRMPDMIAEYQELLRIDPANPANARRAHLIGYGHLMLGHPQEALLWLQRAGAGLAQETPREAVLSWQEWRQIYLIAAQYLTGDRDGATRRAAAYRALQLHRTVWRLASYDNRAIAALPGRAPFWAALTAAGLPGHADEHEDFGLPPSATPREGGDFAATPLTIAGASRIDTDALRKLLSGPEAARPLLLDVGRGAAVIPGSAWIGVEGAGSRDRWVVREAANAHADLGRPIVVAGDGTTGWNGYDAALALVAAGYRSVLWYRGGNEAWAAAGNPAQDRRVQ